MTVNPVALGLAGVTFCRRPASHCRWARPVTLILATVSRWICWRHFRCSPETRSPLRRWRHAPIPVGLHAPLTPGLTRGFLMSLQRAGGPSGPAHLAGSATTNTVHSWLHVCGLRRTPFSALRGHAPDRSRS